MTVVALMAVTVSCGSGDAQPATPATAPAEVSVGDLPTVTARPAPTVPPTTVPPTTVAATTSTTLPGLEQIGTSVQGRPIEVQRRGTPGGTPIVVIGVIHGNEDAGVAIIDELRDVPVPEGVELWLIESVNPDGQHDDRRTNANLVDLNRNFPHDWTPIATPGEWEYSGSGPASEPETQAIIAFMQRVEPRLTIWYHQDLFRLSPARGVDGELRARYAELTGLPIEPVTGGTYTGVAATWVRRSVPEAVSFIVELGPTLSAAEAVVHAAAVLDLATRV